MRPSLPAFALALGLVALAAPASAQPADDRPLIVVVGRGDAEQPAEFAVVEARVRGEGDTQLEALSALEAARAQVQDGLAALEGAGAVRVETSEIRIERVYGRGCENSDYIGRRSTGDCQPQGYVATLGLALRISPAERAGEALSLASELGAVGVELDDTGLEDMEGLRDAASRAAMADAVRQARLVAEAAGGRVGALVRIQDTRAQFSNRLDLGPSPETVVVTGSRVRPAVRVEFSPEPVAATASLTVVFELER